jgi:hypothetical protein
MDGEYVRNWKETVVVCLKESEANHEKGTGYLPNTSLVLNEMRGKSLCLI